MSFGAPYHVGEISIADHYELVRLALEILQYVCNATRFLNKEIISAISLGQQPCLFRVRNHIEAELLCDEARFEARSIVAAACGVREDCGTCSELVLTRAQTCLIRK